MALAKKQKLERVRLVSPVGRLVFVYIATKDEGRPNSSNKYKVDLLIPKTEWKEKGAELREAVLMVARDYFNDEEITLKDFKNPFKNGDDKEQDFYKGMVYMTIKSEFKPAVVGPDRIQWTDEQITTIKGGDYARVVVSVYPYEQQGGGVTMGLETIQFARPGEALGGGRASSVNMLDDLDIELDDMALGSDDEDEAPPVTKKKAPPAATPITKKKAPAKVEEPEEEEEDEDEDLSAKPAVKTRKPRAATKPAAVEEEEDEAGDDMFGV